MYINAVLSNLGAWDKLRHNDPVEFKSIQKVIASSDFRKARARGGKADDSFVILDGYIRPQRLNLLLAHYFEDAGWHARTQKGWKKNRPYDMDAVKDGIGVDFAFDSAASVESDLFVKFPFFIHTGRINLGVVLTGTEPIAKCIFGQDNRYEIVCDRITKIRPMPLRALVQVYG